MTLTFHALWMLCALGAVVFAAATPPGWRASAAIAAGFALAAVFTSIANLPDAVWTGGMAVGAVAVYLFKPRFRLVSLAAGGALAGFWSALLEVQGLPVIAALLVAAALLIVAMRLSQSRESFAPEVLREEGLLAIAVLGVGVAVLPGVLDGWQAATNLSGVPERGEMTSIPMWTLLLILMSSSMGALYSFWNRR